MNLLEQQGYICFLQQTESSLLEAYCGKKHARIKRNHRRVKTVTRQLLTRFGKITLKITYIINRAEQVFSPLLRRMGIKKYQRMSEELQNILRDKASKMTYADTAEDLFNSFNLQINRQQVWRINQQKELAITSNNASHRILLADGTKTRCNKGGHLEPRAVMSVDLDRKEKCLLAFEVGVKWQEIANKLNLTQYTVLVGDAETGLRQAFTQQGIDFQLCHLHAIRDMSLYLWYDKLEKNARTEFMKPFKEALYTVQNSVKKYWQDKNKYRVYSRVLQANKQINRLTAKARQRELGQTADFLEHNRQYLFTAAKLAVQQNLKVPWTTNQIERVMKEIGKRTKKKSMRWSTNGLKTILNAVLKRYFLPTQKRNHKNIYGGE